MRQPCKNTTFPTRQPREITPSLADLSAYEIRVRVGLQSGNIYFPQFSQKIDPLHRILYKKKKLTICCRFGMVGGAVV
jgi:hypothetical protein